MRTARRLPRGSAPGGAGSSWIRSEGHDEQVEAVVPGYITLENQRQRLRARIAAVEERMDDPIRDLIRLGEATRRIQALLNLTPEEARSIRRLRTEQRARDAGVNAPQRTAGHGPTGSGERA